MPSTDPLLARTIDEDRERGLDRRHAIARARRDAGDARSSRWTGSLIEAARHLLRSPDRPWPIGHRAAAARGVAASGTTAADRLLTDLPCRTLDGRAGRIEVVLAEGAWTLYCRRT
jgi:hypothetical protein